MRNVVLLGVAVLLLIDHLAVPGYLASWSNTKGLLTLKTAITWFNFPSNKSEEEVKVEECRQSQNDYDRLLLNLGVNCLN